MPSCTLPVHRKGAVRSQKHVIVLSVGFHWSVSTNDYSFTTFTGAWRGSQPAHAQKHGLVLSRGPSLSQVPYNH